MILLVYLSLLTNSTPLQRNMSILDLLYFAIRARSRTRFDLSVSFVCKLNLGHSPPPRLYITLSDMPRSLESGEHHVLLAFNRKRSGELMRPHKGSLTLNLFMMRTCSIFQVVELPFPNLEPTKVRHERTGFLGFLGANLDNVTSPRRRTPFDPVPSESGEESLDLFIS